MDNKELEKTGIEVTKETTPETSAAGNASAEDVPDTADTVAETVSDDAGTISEETANQPEESEVSPEPAEDEVPESMEDYTAELESSLRKIHEGDVMEGEVIAFNEHGVILDLSYYATGRVPVEEMSADPAFNIMTDVQIGDRFSAVVKKTDDGKGNILLSKKAAESELSWDKLRALKEEDAVISGTVSDVVRAGAIMYVEGIRGFIPASKLDRKYVEDTSVYLGRKLNVKISEIDEEREKLILSAKELMTEAFVREQEESISKLSVGSVLDGIVESLKNYGAFVNIGDGVSGLLHISEISEKRINHPKAVLRPGQQVKVMITRIEGGKISLSMKAVLEAEEKELEEETPHEYHSEHVANTPFADLL